MPYYGDDDDDNDDDNNNNNNNNNLIIIIIIIGLIIIIELIIIICGTRGSMRACHAAGPGSIPGRDKFPGEVFSGFLPFFLSQISLHYFCTVIFFVSFSFQVEW